MVAEPRRDLILSAAMAWLGRGLATPARTTTQKTPDPARDFFQNTIEDATHPSCTASSTWICYRPKLAAASCLIAD
jgi:hypothetical protein